MTTTQLLKQAKSSCAIFNNIDTETKNKVLQQGQDGIKEVT